MGYHSVVDLAAEMAMQLRCAHRAALGAGIAWTAARQRADPAWVGAACAWGLPTACSPNTVARCPCLPAGACAIPAAGISPLASKSSKQPGPQRRGSLPQAGAAGGRRSPQAARGGGTTGGASAAGRGRPPGPAAASAAALAAGGSASACPAWVLPSPAWRWRWLWACAVAIAGEELLVGTRRRCKGGRVARGM